MLCDTGQAHKATDNTSCLCTLHSTLATFSRHFVTAGSGSGSGESQDTLGLGAGARLCL